VLADWKQLRAKHSASAANSSTDQFSSSIRVPRRTKPANGELNTMSTSPFLRRRDGLEFGIGLRVRNTQGEFIKAKTCCFSRVLELMALLEFLL